MTRWIDRSRVPLILNLVAISCIALAWIVYAFFGHALVASMYKGESLRFLNAIIEGQKSQSLVEYFQVADRAMEVISLVVLASSLAATIVIKADKMALRRFAGTVVLLLASLTVSLLAAEWCVRTMFREVTTTGDNSSYFARRWIATHPPAKNRWGFREREFSDTPSEGVYRIAVIGDSFTWGQGILDDDRVTNMLERTLNTSAKRYEVLNFGRCGAETVDELALLHDKVLKASPDFVLLQWYINDVEEPDHAKRPAGWPLPFPKKLSRRLHESSALFYLVEDAWWSAQSALGIGESYEHYLRRRFLDADGPDSRAAFGLLAQFIAETQARGISMGIIVYPDLGYDPAPDRPYPLAFLLDRVMETCESSKIPCLDLRPTLITVRPARRLWVDRFDDHPNRTADELAAGAILKRFHDAWNAPGS